MFTSRVRSHVNIILISSLKSYAIKRADFTAINCIYLKTMMLAVIKEKEREKLYIKYILFVKLSLRKMNMVT